METASSVRTGIALGPKSGTTTDDLLQNKEKIVNALGSGRVEADERWVIVKVYGLPTKVTTLDENNSLSSKDVSIEQDVLSEVAARSQKLCTGPICEKGARWLQSGWPSAQKE